MTKAAAIEAINDRLKSDLTYKNICSCDIETYRQRVMDLFTFINSYKSIHDIGWRDFRPLLDFIYSHINLDKGWQDEAWEDCRYILIIDELAIYHTREPYFWDTPFEEYKIKLNRLLSYEV